MAYSMTGIGEGRITEEGFDISVVIRSVNHRFFNLQIRMPRGYHRYETVLREKISQSVTRGKVDVNVDFYSLPPNVGEVILNIGYGANLCQQIQNLAAALNIPDGLTAERLVRFNDMFTSLPPKDGDANLDAMLFRALQLAMEDFLGSRLTEGTHLVVDMKRRVNEILVNKNHVQRIAETQPCLVRERLQAALKDLDRDTKVDPKRLEEEILMWAVRSDVTEELTRLDGHIQRILSVIGSDRAIGKELDFMIQELHREINTIGSKSVAAEINQRIVSMKMEVEKLREQAQNLE